jgi:4-hydroxy-tetrahydrodipicolinate synthase
VTPYDATDEIAPKILQPIIDRAVMSGIAALTINGNTSEFYSLTFDEARQMQAAVPPLIDRRAFVTAGVGRSVAEASQLAKSARADGADAIMIHQPPDPFRASRGMLDYTARVAEAADGLPVVIYLRDDSGGLDFIDKLCRLPRVAGVKWATGNILLLAAAIRRHPGISWICGLAEPWAPPMHAVGARGFTSGIINLAPHLSQGVLEALRRNDLVAAGALIERLDPFEKLRTQENNGANVSVVKAALALQGHAVGPARPPAAWPLAAETTTAIRHIFDSWKTLS